MLEKPNIHLFKIYDKQFLYDVDTNSIVKITQALYDYLGSILDCSNTKELEEVLFNITKDVKVSL